MSRQLLLSVAAASLVALTGAAVADQPQVKNEAVKKVQKSVLSDPNKVIVVSRDKREFTLYLKSNPTTGFSWVLTHYNDEMVNPVSHHFVAPDTKLVGAPGVEKFTFKVDKDSFNVPEKTTIELQYIRPWVVSNNTQKISFTVITQSK